jgi:5'-phosphate synthase pdxT subunit
MRVRTPEELARVDRLIIPGGESTTMLKFLKQHAMSAPIREFAKQRPVWGICAGAILIAREVVNPNQDSLGLIDITAHRNFYGSQRESFTTTLVVDLVSRPIQAQFIRAPLLSKATDLSSQRLPVVARAIHEDTPVFFSQGHIWACSFHVELGDDTSLHSAFLSCESSG